MNREIETFMTRFLCVACLASVMSCGGFEAKRQDAEQSDEKAMSITDNWVGKDTTLVVKQILRQMKEHKGYQRFRAKFSGQRPKVFVAEVQNRTSEPYFPIQDLNDELLYELSSMDEFVLVDAAARDKLLQEITYQNDGMVDPAQIKTVGKQVGADLMVFGNVYMRPEERSGKRIKQYTVNLRLTSVEEGREVLRTRAKINKYSKKGGWGL